MEKICGICLIALCALLLLRQYAQGYASLLRIAAGCACAGALLTMTIRVVQEIPGLYGAVLPENVQTVMLKAFGLSLLAELAGAVCRDSGENGLALWVEYAGRLELLVLSLPLLRELFGITASFLGQA